MASTNTPVSTESATRTPTNTSPRSGVIPSAKALRPFLYTTPVRFPCPLPAEVHDGLAELEQRVGEDVQGIVRSLVNYTVSVHNARTRATGSGSATTVSVLNRRRRAARAWVLAILTGRVDGTTLHTLTHTWLPQLIGTGPDTSLAVAPGERLVEFLRGNISARVMDEPADNLVLHAKALHGLEVVLGIHLQAVRDQAAD